MLELTRCTVDLRRRRVLKGAAQTALTGLEAALLGYLVEREGQDVSREELLAAVWGYAPATTTRAVDSVVARLRGKLDEPQPPQHLLTVHGHGYRFVLSSQPAPLAPAPPALRVRLAAGELDLGRRQLVAADGALHPLSKLEAEVLGLLVERLGQTVPRELLLQRVWGRGDHQHALESLVQRLRRRLEPDPLRPSVLVTVRGEGLRLEPCAADLARRTDLTLPRTPFQPRPEADRVLAGPGLVTLLGAAGIGKTRLAKECGLRWLGSAPDAEARLCDLTGTSSAEGLVGAVAELLGVALDGVAAPAEHLGRALAQRRSLLLVLDNFEQLLPAAPVVARWAAQAPGLRLVVTSRIALGVPGERVIELAPLEEDGAARLFAARVPGADPDAPEVRALVARLDGLPLAIELAAARAASLGAAEVLRRLGERLDLLCRRPSASETQHSTLRGALDWSWDLLGADDRLALALSSVFVGPFPTAAAQAVLGPDAPQRLGSLALQSLVRQEGDERWALFESTRDYAREKLLLSGHRAQAEAAHADFFTGWGEAWLARMDREPLAGWRAELLAVHERSPAHRARVALVLHAVFDRHRDHAAAVRLLRATLEEDCPAELRWQLWARLAAAESAGGAEELGVPSARVAVGYAREVGARATAVALQQLALCQVFAGRPLEAEALLLEVLDRARELADEELQSRCLVCLPVVAASTGRDEEALRWIEVSEGRDSRWVGALHLRAVLLTRKGDLQGARAAAERFLERVTRTDNPVMRLHHDALMADILAGEGELGAARALLLACCSAYLSAGDGMRAAVTLHQLAVFAALAGDLEAAWQHAQQAETCPTTRDQQVVLGMVQGVLLHLRGEPQRAREILAQWLARAGGLPVQQAYLGLALSMALASCGQLDEAERAARARPVGMGALVTERLERLAEVASHHLRSDTSVLSAIPPAWIGQDPYLGLAAQILARCHNLARGAGLP
jgi:DNA-binding response OmpR family regulator/predicted ATPase